MSDTEEQRMREAAAEMADYVRRMVIHRVAQLLAKHPGTRIDFYDEPRFDEYGTVSLGEWGGYIIQIMPMIFNDRLIMTAKGNEAFHDHGWCYDKGGAAFLAAFTWDPETQGEPDGFKKRATAGIREPGEKADPNSVNAGMLLLQALRGIA